MHSIRHTPKASRVIPPTASTRSGAIPNIVSQNCEALHVSPAPNFLMHLGPMTASVCHDSVRWLRTMSVMRVRFWGHRATSLTGPSIPPGRARTFCMSCA
jgi:hypothetical protein